MPIRTHKYEKDGVTVVWEPAKCTHSGVCVRGLGVVFNPQARPWIAIDAAPIGQIIEQVRRCPSGALSIAGDEA